MMVLYVAVPARLIGSSASQSPRDKLWTTIVGGAYERHRGNPPVALARIGVLMLGSSVLFIPGLVVLAIGVTLQAGATGAVSALKMSVTLTSARGNPASASGSAG